MFRILIASRGRRSCRRRSKRRRKTSSKATRRTTGEGSPGLSGLAARQVKPGDSGERVRRWGPGHSSPTRWRMRMPLQRRRCPTSGTICTSDPKTPLGTARWWRGPTSQPASNLFAPRRSSGADHRPGRAGRRGRRIRPSLLPLLLAHVVIGDRHANLRLVKSRAALLPRDISRALPATARCRAVFA